MRPKILAIYYSQSGQAKEVSDTFFSKMDADVTYYEIKPSRPFPFPWSTFTFFNAFPETFVQKAVALDLTNFPSNQAFDLVVLIYQPWFLTPSLPVASFLQTDVSKNFLRNKNVITFSCSRNMWLGAQEKVKVHLKNSAAKLVGNIAVVDNSPNLKSVITILRWMLTGKRSPFLIFPKAGIQDEDVAKTALYGEIVKQQFGSGDYSTLQHRLNEAGAVVIKPSLLLLEKRGQKAFKVWAKFIGMADADSITRKIRVGLFSFLLPTVVFILSPILTIVSSIMLVLQKDKLNKTAEKFKQNDLVDFF